MPATDKPLKLQHHYGQLPPAFYSRINPQPLSDSRIIHINNDLVKSLGLPVDQSSRIKLHNALQGLTTLEGSQPLAMKYTGHQFGYYNPDLGDGRGLLLGEWQDAQGTLWDLHLKGAGQTPYSRQGDGRAVLRSSIREYLASEAMAGLGIPTTRALCLVGSGESVYRERIESGALLTRVSTSHLRFGHFEFCYYNGDHTNLRILADYAINRYFPDYREKSDKYVKMLREVIHRTAELVALWQSVGFNHGVMNTDNMSIIGETFDYGPFAFLDDYQANYICNHSDHAGRYAFDRQPSIALWNCQCLAQALLPLIDEDSARHALHTFEPVFSEAIQKHYRQKLGLSTDLPGDAQLIQNLLTLMHQQKVDFTMLFRRLAHFESTENHGNVRDVFVDRERFDRWADEYDSRLQQEECSTENRYSRMQAKNPKFILRNYLAQIAIQKAEQGDFTEVDRLFTLLKQPFDEQAEYEHYAGFPPGWGKSMEISCSS